MTDLIDSARRIFAQGQFKYVLLMMLLLRVDCLRTTITAFSPLYRGASDQSAGRATRILHPRPSTSGDQKQDSGPDEICIPDMLKDVIVEAIEDLGGGKVKEVKLRQSFLTREHELSVLMLLLLVYRIRASNPVESRHPLPRPSNLVYGMRKSRCLALTFSQDESCNLLYHAHLEPFVEFLRE